MKILTLTNGEKHEVIAEEGKFFVCKDFRLKKTNPLIASVDALEEEKKASPKKSKKAKETKEKEEE